MFFILVAFGFIDYIRMARTKKALADDDPEGKGRLVLVVWPADGKKYKAKVVGTKGDSVKVHYVRWNTRHDEWIKKADPRIDWLEPVEKVSSPTPPRGIDDSPAISSPAGNTGNESAEKLIDSLYASICPEPATTKRGRDDSHSEVSDKAPKRQLLDSGDNSSDNIPSSISAAGGGGVAGGAGDGRGAGASGGVPDAAELPALSGQPAPTVNTSNPTPNTGTTARSDNLCGLCRLPTGRNTIKCSGCQMRFHPSVLCLGVVDEVVRALGSERSGALLYRCCACRSGEPYNGESVVQLTRIVGELVRSAKTQVTNKVSPGSGVEQETIISQIREVREREKRKDSIIFRGVGNVPLDILKRNFEVICDLLNVEGTTLTELKKIGSSPPLYRARIQDDTKRKEILLRCHQLRNSEEFSRVYIHRDLTRQQRRDLASKRAEARRLDNPNSPGPQRGRRLEDLVPQNRVPPRAPVNNSRGGRGRSQVTRTAQGSTVAERIQDMRRTRDNFVRNAQNVLQPPRQNPGLNSDSQFSRVHRGGGGPGSSTSQNSRGVRGRGRPRGRGHEFDGQSNANWIHARGRGSASPRRLTPHSGRVSSPTRGQHEVFGTSSGRRMSRAHRRLSSTNRVELGTRGGRVRRSQLRVFPELEYGSMGVDGDDRTRNDFNHPLVASSPMPPQRGRGRYRGHHGRDDDSSFGLGRGGSGYFPRRSLN